MQLPLTAKRALEFFRSLVFASKDLARTKRELAQTKQRLVQAERRVERTTERLKERTREAKSIARDYLLLKVPKGAVCAEIGVHEGEFSRQILDAGEPKLLHLIDPWTKGEGLTGKLVVDEQAVADERHEKVRERFASEIEAGRVKIHRALASEAAGEFEDSSLDWVYIDGNHLYEFVKQDLELYYPKVKTGGYIAGDDYGIPGQWENGVQEAVDEFVAQRPELALETKRSQFIIRKTPPLGTTAP